jgi:excisionase family DNA binding protein
VSEELLTVPEVAALLRLSEQTVRKWLREGTLAGIQLGSRQAGWRVRRSDVDRFLAERQRGEGAAA